MFSEKGTADSRGFQEGKTGGAYFAWSCGVTRAFVPPPGQTLLRQLQSWLRSPAGWERGRILARAVKLQNRIQQRQRVAHVAIGIHGTAEGVIDGVERFP